MSTQIKLVLASSSPYRQAILEKLKIEFYIEKPQIEESACANETPENQALRLCKLKAYALNDKYNNHLIIGSDQVAVTDNKQLHKPGNRANSIKQLTLVAGRQVHFYTSVGVLDSYSGQFLSALEHHTVTFKELSSKEINSYVDKDKPYNCAGAFKSEGLGITLVKSIIGEDPNALIGLPLIKLINLLELLNFKII